MGVRTSEGLHWAVMNADELDKSQCRSKEREREELTEVDELQRFTVDLWSESG